LGQTTYRKDPDALAHRLGIRVINGAPPHGWWGAYLHAYRAIILRHDLGPHQRRSTLAHELGHAHYGHTGHHPSQERLADRYAANLLINADELLDAILTHQTIPALSAELGVMPSLVTTYLEEHHESLRRRVRLPEG
jgi:Zn-dependent peptidase ImmA (M78 family)